MRNTVVIILLLLLVFAGFFLSSRAKPLEVVFEHRDGVYNKTLADVAHITVEHKGQRYNLNAYGLTHVLDMLVSGYRSDLVGVKIRGLSATSRRSRIMPWREIVTIKYGTKDAAWWDDVAAKTTEIKGVPTILLAPPGAWGSSGSLKLQYQEDSFEIVSLALERLKQEIGAKRFVISGSSSSGLVASGLLLTRNDLECVVIASAPLDLRIFLKENPELSSLLGAKKPFNPSENVDRILRDSSRKILIGYNHKDEIVSSKASLNYGKLLADRGHVVSLQSAPAIDSKNHEITLWRDERVEECSQNYVR